MGDSKKIGIDVRLWNETGIGRYIRNLVKELVSIDKDNQYVLFCQTKDLSHIKSQIAGLKYGSQVVFIPSDIKWHTISEQIEFPKLLNSYDLDLMHFPYFSVPVFYKKPFVVTVHDLIINHFPTGRASTLPRPLYHLKRLGYSYVLKTALKNAKKVIVPTNATKKEIENEYHTSPSKIAVTLEGVDDTISDFAPVIFSSKDPYFLYVGNAYPHKNLERLLEAFKLFTVQNPEFVLKLVGKEDYFYKRIKEYVKKENIQGVEFLGFVSDDKLSILYREATATVIPSLMEGFGLTALEAMQMGTVIICSKIPSLEEVCRNNAFYFTSTDTLSLAETLSKVKGITKEEKKKIAEKGKKHAETFSWKKMAKETLDIYNAILE